MDTVYAVLFTAATVAAMLLATLFFFSKQESPRSPAAKVLTSTASPSPERVRRHDVSEESVESPRSAGSCEDADGPINLTYQPASDDDIWKVWFDQPAQSKGMSKGQFEDSMKVLGTFNTMADFWDRFSNLMHEKLPTKSNVRVFQSNVRPLWEDPINCDGGKWIVVVPKQKSVGVFNEVLAAMVGGKFECEVSGLVLSKKVREDLVSVWTPSGLPVSSLEVLRDNISKLLETHLGLKPEITFMSHDKKNKVQIQGRAEKKPAGEKPEKSQERKSKFTGVKPNRSKGGSPPMSAREATNKPKSPMLAPREEQSAAEKKTEHRPKTPDTNPLMEGQKRDKGAIAGVKGKGAGVAKAATAEGDWEVVHSRGKTKKTSSKRHHSYA